MKNKLSFYKYQGAGNDFILIDDRTVQFDENRTELVGRLCDRRFGIGADGLMLLREKSGFDFEMIYFNADGKVGSMCGNGGRCIARFSDDIGFTAKPGLRFLAADGPHEAELKNGIVRLKMSDVSEIETGDGFYFLDTGSPHYVKYVSGLDELDVFGEGRKIRYSDRFAATGTNVNFIEPFNGGIKIRTYERGVENETLACGTGVTAAALTAALKGIATSAENCRVKARGGDLNVTFRSAGKNQFTDIWLEGPAEFVYKGEISI
ncbi:MAG: diaminopimelate epimerase [Bacteroidetes bacterium]|nr:MAG: diaminopimelate epimerase [Bacteroidota bacterium]